MAVAVLLLMVAAVALSCVALVQVRTLRETVTRDGIILDQLWAAAAGPVVRPTDAESVIEPVVPAHEVADDELPR